MARSPYPTDNPLDGRGAGAPISQEAARYNIEVLRRGYWVPTDDRGLSYVDARRSMRLWASLNCSSRMIAAAEGRAS